MRQICLVLLLLSAAGASGAVDEGAAEDQSAIATITAFDATLTAAMHQDRAPLKSAIGSMFDVPTMAASIVGASWAGMSQQQQAAVSAALERYLFARFAHEFDSFDGEAFQINPQVQTRGQDKLVRTQVGARGSEATMLYYRLRNRQGRWRIIDVYYDGVSQLATQRADLAAVAADYPALLAQIQRATPALQ
jgi:phospholipid transport system substrate-binding protein